MCCSWPGLAGVSESDEERIFHTQGHKITFVLIDPICVPVPDRILRREFVQHVPRGHCWVDKISLGICYKLNEPPGDVPIGSSFCRLLCRHYYTRKKGYTHTKTQTRLPLRRTKLWQNATPVTRFKWPSFSEVTASSLVRDSVVNWYIRERRVFLSNERMPQT